MTEKYLFDEEKKKDMEIRIEAVNSKIASAAKRSGRSIEDITLIGVSKFFPPENAALAVSLGLDHLGENRVQEMLSKKEQVEAWGYFANWHLIGNLQLNKVKSIIGKTSLVHSVSSIKLLDEIEKRSEEKNTRTSVLLEINIAKEKSKHGFLTEEVEKAVEYSQKLGNIELCGIMSMAPLISGVSQIGKTDGEESTPYFFKMKQLFDHLAGKTARKEQWRILSMGMSQDYETAIHCGATHIRVGTAIFGKRVIV